MANYDYRSAADEQAAQKNAAHDQSMSELFRALMQGKIQSANQQKMLAAQAQQAQDLAKYKDTLGQQALGRNQGLASQFVAAHPGYGVTVGENGNFSVSKPTDMGVAADRHERLIGDQAAKYSKNVEDNLAFTDALQDLENVTNKINGGKGGILSNGSYKPLSGGYIASLQDHPQAIAAMEAAGVVPKGATEEAKALARFRLAYQRSMTGMRTSDEMAKREASAMGMTSSNDPLLLAKGVRALAGLAKNKIQVQQSPYSQEALDRVNSRMGNPLESFPKVYNDNDVSGVAQGPAPGARGAGAQQNGLSAFIGGGQPAVGATQSPQNGPAPMSFDEFKARKRAGTL